MKEEETIDDFANKVVGINELKQFLSEKIETFRKSFIKTLNKEIKEEPNMEICTGLSHALNLFEKEWQQFKKDILNKRVKIMCNDCDCSEEIKTGNNSRNL